MNDKDGRYTDWNKLNHWDSSSFPEEGRDIVYRFNPGLIEEIDSEWRGTYEDGTFFSKGGFCCLNDVTHWKYV